MMDDELETTLRGVAAELADAGFTEAVMRRVSAEEAALLDAQAALAALRQRDARAHRGARWRWMGAGVGVALAAAPLLVMGLPALQGPQQLALALAASVAAWALAAPALRERA
jgi:negative regulator of sigma E activity